MSRALPIVTAILTILHSYVSAQTANVTPATCLSGYNAFFNSLGQSPCTIADGLGGACNNGVFSLNELQPGFLYLGPTPLDANSCLCSSVFYSVLSACAYCQSESYLDWSIYNANCTVVYTEVFIDPIPSSIVVPHYAYLDVVTSNTFNVTAAENAGGPESSSFPQATSSSIVNSTPTSVTTTSKKVDVAAIAGGVVGGLAFFGIGVGLIAFIILRSRRRANLRRSADSATAPFTYNAPSPATTGGMTYNSTVPTMGSYKIYNPNDPSTFPSDPVGHPTMPGNNTLGGVVPVRTTQYTGVPEPC